MNGVAEGPRYTKETHGNFNDGTLRHEKGGVESVPVLSLRHVDFGQ